MNNHQSKMIYLLAFASGFLSLSLEVIWIRIISFAGHSVPQAFSYTLALFLLGIAFGAHMGRKICKENPTGVSVELIGRYFGLAALVDTVVFGLMLAFAYLSVDSFVGLAGALVLISASVRGIVFPLVHHLGTVQSKSGKQISNVYFSNVLGSSIAPLMISFFVLDWLSTQQVYFAICLLSFVVATLCLCHQKKIAGASGIMVTVLALGLMLPEQIFHMLSRHNVGDNQYPVTLIENKHGFIQVYKNSEKQYEVWGANVYDGKFNTDIFNESNGIERAYLLPAVKPDAENVLVIGLSTGSWVRVLSTMPNIKKMTVVEINPDYVNLIKQYPDVAPLLQDKRIEIVVDDGRRWLRRHDEQFDMVLMNTTWHWRAYGANLLSQEFLTMIRQHLKPDGVALYNTTYFMNAYATAHSVFPHTYMYKNMALVANKPIALPEPSMMQERMARLVYPENQQRVFNTPEQADLAGKQISQYPLESYNQLVESGRNLGKDAEIITDNNMISEYKYGLGL